MIMAYVVLSLIPDSHYDNDVGVCKYVPVERVMTYWLTDCSHKDTKTNDDRQNDYLLLNLSLLVPFDPAVEIQTSSS